MIVNVPGGAKYRAQMFGGADVIPLPSQEGGIYSGFTNTGRYVGPEQAVGLPAILAGIRFLAETVATLPLIVYRDIEGIREKARDSDQWTLLHDKPNDVQTPFDFKAFAVSSMIGYGGFLAQKVKAKSGRLKGTVLALYPLDPRKWFATREDGEVVFKVRDPKNPTGALITLTRRDVLYIPGVLWDDPHIGVSPIRVSANAIATALGTEEYAGRFFANDATPRGVVKFPFNADSQQAKDAKAAWNEGGQGVGKSHQTRVLYGKDSDYMQIGVNAQDAQIIESQRWSVEQAGRVLRLPTWALGGTDSNIGSRSTPEQRNMELLQFSVSPWLVRIEEAVHADDDLFPDKDLFGEFLADGMLRADTAARYAAYLQARQAGWLSANDIRAKENEPPIEGGDEYQFTPVGGAPNLQPGQGDDPNAVTEPANPAT